MIWTTEEFHACTFRALITAGFRKVQFIAQTKSQSIKTVRENIPLEYHKQKSKYNKMVT
jgi:hypothetical protein